MIPAHLMAAFLFDFFPVLLFFAAFKVWDLMVATAVLIVATLLQTAWSWWHKGKVNRMHLLTAVLVLVFGGITLLLEDEIFIKWKPTVVNWLFAAAFLGSQWLAGGKPLIRRMMEHGIALPDAIWLRLNMAWSAFFLLLGGLNLCVVHTFDTATWVNFKLFGMVGLTVAFAFAQGFYMVRHVEDRVEPQ
jgi:intracellular septation protein